MKAHYIITILISTLSTLVYGQNTFLIGQTKYQSTESFTLESKKEFDGHNLDVVIVKDGEGGMIVISTEVFPSSSRIRGNILIYLDNGNVITCIDRGKYDFVDDISTAIYYLTKDEINKIRKSNINSIRFTIKCVDCYYATAKDFSAYNEKRYSFNENDRRTDVPRLVNELFGSYDKERITEVQEEGSNERYNTIGYHPEMTQMPSDYVPCRNYLYKKNLAETREEYRYLFKTKTHTNPAEQLIKLPPNATLYVIEESNGTDQYYYVCYYGSRGFISKYLLK